MGGSGSVEASWWNGPGSDEGKELFGLKGWAVGVGIWADVTELGWVELGSSIIGVGGP